MMTIELNSGRIKGPFCYWYPDIQQSNHLSFGEAAGYLKELFLDNIRFHLRSDVPLGVALSGGIDSSAVACAVRKVEPGMPIHTFSYIAQKSSISEEYWINRINDHIKSTSHQIFITAQELEKDIDDFIFAQGEPFGSTSIYAQYRVFKKARDCGITVILEGQGADELLAGYQGYPTARLQSLFYDGHLIDAAKFFKNWSKWPGRDVKNALASIGYSLLPEDLKGLADRILGKSKYPAWINPGVLHEKGVRLQTPHFPFHRMAKGRHLMSRLASDLTRKGLLCLLRHGDRNSMMFSIESRVPFLTKDMAEFLLSLPEEYLISMKGETKSIFREAMRGVVPDDVLNRKDKIGFETPELDIFRQLRPKIGEWILESRNVPFLNFKEISKQSEQILNGDRKFSWQMWRWINFLRWIKLLNVEV
jgi:asparagine synthase (glutamine-hydrolysing)